MSGIKLIVTGMENSGKTYLVSQIKNSLLMATDNKAFKGKVPHFRYNEYDGIDDFINTIESKLEKYKEKFNKYPKNFIIDSVTHLQANMEKWANDKFSGFQIWNNLGKDILSINEYFEYLIENGLNVILTVHVQYDVDTGVYKVAAPGQFGRNGAWLGVTDESIFLQIKGNKRLVHFKTLKYPCRTLQEDLPDSVEAKEFDINKHIELLEKNVSESKEWEI